MLIGGLQKLSSVDYPKKIAATVFTVGCNFRCPYCHNPELVDEKRINKQPIVKEGEFFKFLQTRRGLIDGICLTGGEPTIQPDLVKFIRRIKKLGFLVKLDTNGSQPDVLKNLFRGKLLDFVAMDIKNSPRKYDRTVGVKADFKNISQSIGLIKGSGVDYEFRITVAPNLIGEKGLEDIATWLSGAKCFALQQFQAAKTLDESWQGIRPYREEKIRDMAEKLKPFFGQVIVRGL